MAQYVYSMLGVGKVVAPKKHILKDISLSFFSGAKIGVLGLNGAFLLGEGGQLRLEGFWSYFASGWKHCAPWVGR